MSQQLTLTGNLGGMPTTRRVGKQSVTNLRVAVNEYSADGRPVTTWYEVALWNELSDQAQNLTTGQRVTITGSRLQAKPYLDAQGNARASLHLTADRIVVAAPRTVPAPQVAAPPAAEPKAKAKAKAKQLTQDELRLRSDEQRATKYPSYRPAA